MAAMLARFPGQQMPRLTVRWIMRRAFTLLAFVSILLWLWPQAASAQVGIWLQKGTSGVGVGAGVRGNGDQVELTLGGGYSYKGFLDFELDVGYIWPSNPIPDDLKVVEVSPGVIYHALKQGPDMPISLSVGAFYNQLFVQSQTLSDEGIDATEYGLTGSVAVYRFFRLGEQTGIIPAVSLGVSHSWTTFKEAGFADSTTEDTSVGVTFGAYFAYIDDGGRIYGLVPAVTVGDVTVVGLSLNIVWSLQ
jgi:hypothetical protein